MTDDTPLLGIGKILERMMDHAPGTRTPPESWPARFRFKCLACEDLGVERYIHPEHPDVAHMRPCTHCDQGKKTLAAWLAPAKSSDNDIRSGPWYGMSQDEVDRIQARCCTHDPLPAVPQRPALPARTALHELVPEPVGSR